MESGTTYEPKPAASETENVANTDSAESFQSFIYELFEKNGILNDLRAYLRGHIVNLLTSAQTGDPPACQKNFTQRLDLTNQALNMLVAEYLMRLEFSYSFSVFVSEIPLANMVFGFAKSLMERVDDTSSEIRFKEADVWSILNYLGVQCDSEHASKIIQMYNNEPQNPLLLCILKGIPMYKECISQQSPSGVSVCDSTEIEAELRKNSPMSQCRHCSSCRKCKSKMYKLKERYKRKKKFLAKNANKYKPSPCPSDSFAKSETIVKNISIVEKSLIEEMFQQMKSVYETEVEMVKVEEQKKVEYSMATHAIELQKKRKELEEAFKAREQELERSVQHKKKFLWGLARSLRDQHLHMTRAMHNVRAETERLEIKEDSLKSQLAEAEHILKKRGEEMRAQISNELAILEALFASMKRERESITRECSELENLETIQDTPSKVIKVHNMESEEVPSHFDILKNELEILKTYLESSQMQAKCVIERGTMTEPTEQVSHINVALNNSQGNEKGSKSDDFDERVKMNQLVNDFKKKNVNFSQSNLDEIYERSRDRSRSSNSSEAGDTAAPDLDLERGRDRDRDLIQRLREENDRLKAFARQRCAEATRPHTAPAAPARVQRMLNLNNSISASTLNVGWRKGAGEELSMFSNAQPRILVPGDTLPFIGVLRDRHGNNRRPQCAGRARALCGVSKRAAAHIRERHSSGAGSGGQGRVSGSQPPEASCSLQPDEDTYPLMRDRLKQRPRTAVCIDNRNEDKSPKSLHKEAKEHLRWKDSNRGCVSSRDKSPDAVLREAKLRLRKLEIEAEAVEQSYRDFRRRQSERRAPHEPRDGLARALDVTRSHSTHEIDETTRNDLETHFAELQKTVCADFDKYMLDYKTKFDNGETHCRNRPIVSEKVKPVPDTLEVDCSEREVRSYYLEAPLTEFRKLYTSARQSRQIDTGTRTIHSAINSVTNSEFEYEISARNDAIQKVKNSKQAELQILKRNINQMYHSPNRDSTLTVDQQFNQASVEDENNLRVEVESISEINGIKSQTQDLLLVVQGTVNSKVASEVFSAQMTIISSPARTTSPERCARSPSPERRVRSPSPERRVRSPSPERRVRNPSPEQAARLTRNDVLDAIFHADPNDVSSIQMQLALSKDEVSMTEFDKGDYPADFAAAGNYSRSESERSRISLPVMDGGDMAEDDNFWEA